MVEKVLRADLAKRTKSLALRSFSSNFCEKRWRSNIKAETRQIPSICWLRSQSFIHNRKSPGFCRKTRVFRLEKSFPACIDSLYEHWSQFADEHQNSYLNLYSRAKWQATVIVKIDLETNFDTSSISYTDSKKFGSFLWRTVLRNGSETLRLIWTQFLCAKDVLK